MSTLLLLFAPHFIDISFPAGTDAIHFVMDGVFLVIVFMILFGRIKRPGGDDLGDDRLVKFTGLGKFFLRVFRQPFLLFIMIKNRGAVLRALIGKLLVECRGVNIAPEDFKELRITD